MLTAAAQPKRFCRVTIPVALGLAIAVSGPVASAQPVRHAVCLYRDDPRPAGDLPAGIEPNRQTTTRRPAGRRRLTRRAQRRAQRRGDWNHDSTPEISLGEIPIAVTVEPHSGLPVCHRDIPYAGAAEQQRFDLFLPGGCRQGPVPLVVWLPGDDWATVDRANCPIAWLTGHGYAVASIGYRPSTVCRFPAQRDDCRAAVAQLIADAALWGISPDQIAVVGRAGGGHLAALLGLHSHPIEAGGSPAAAAAVPIAAICSVSPVTHLPTLGPEHDRAASAASRLIGGPLPELREAALAASPLSYASGDAPPMLLVHGRNDRLVPVSQSERLHAALQAAGAESQLVIGDAAEAGLSEASRFGRLLLDFLGRTLAEQTTSVVVDDPSAGLGDG